MSAQALSAPAVGKAPAAGSRAAVQVTVNAAPPGAPGEAVALLQLQQLGARVAVPLRAGPYLRGSFGAGWSDSDGDGCSTREEVLMRWMEISPPHGSCEDSGSILDPYTGLLTRADAMEPDHVVPLAEAWAAGAWAWTAAERAAFANDPANLVPTARRLVRSAGDRVGGEWRPPNEWYWCTYVSAYVGMKYQYRLTVTPEEAAGLAAGLGFCAGPWVAGG